jgi:hypothetical protein
MAGWLGAPSLAVCGDRKSSSDACAYLCLTQFIASGSGRSERPGLLTSVER